MRVTDQAIMIGPHNFVRCEDVNVDEDIDYLICGACVMIDETTFLIKNEILYGVRDMADNLHQHITQGADRSN